ncbi:hypothetical protein [Lentzea sp. NPDC059081]|uniref:hypothetical protein n=1 Tax=Lentzea sp. NPDC059081 TaxID=3346719 RepID=UPI00368C9F81
MSMERAQVAMNDQYNATARAQGVVPRAGIPIMYWYQNVDYNNFESGPPGPGHEMTTITADDPCDNAGYLITPTSFWKGNVSSIAGNNNCNVARVYNIGLTDADDFSLFIGGRGHWLERFSDNVGRFQVHA